MGSLHRQSPQAGEGGVFQVFFAKVSGFGFAQLHGADVPSAPCALGCGISGTELLWDQKMPFCLFKASLVCCGYPF